MVGSVVGCGLWVGVVVGQWWLWIGVVGLWSWIGELKWVVVVDRRLKGVVVRGSAAEVGCGRGWVVAEVAPVMTFFEWVCSGGFQIGSGDEFF